MFLLPFPNAHLCQRYPSQRNLSIFVFLTGFINRRTYRELSLEERSHVFRERFLLKRKKNEMFSLWCDALYKLSIANHVSRSTTYIVFFYTFFGLVSRLCFLVSAQHRFSWTRLPYPTAFSPFGRRHGQKFATLRPRNAIGRNRPGLAQNPSYQFNRN